MTCFDFFSKYSDLFYYLTFILGFTNISYSFFEYLSYSHKYDSIQLSRLEGRIHVRLNAMDKKLDEILNQIFESESASEYEEESESEYEEEKESILETKLESIMESESECESESESDDDENDDENENDNSQSTQNKEENDNSNNDDVCVNHEDVNGYYKDQFIKEKQYSLLSIFRGWGLN